MIARRLGLVAARRTVSGCARGACLGRTGGACRALATSAVRRANEKPSMLVGQDKVREQTPGPNELEKFLAATIAATGPISLASYMRQCLTNPTGGYYINRDPFGRSGDFITSPEISQMFGELVGIWVLTQWMAQGRPKQFRLVELGPGRGTLMDDLLRAGRSFPEFYSCLKEIYMIEASPTLRETQRKVLCGDNAKLSATDGGHRGQSQWSKTPIWWYEAVGEVPRDGVPTFVIAHEFFDALPVLSFEHTPDGWKERLVGYDPTRRQFFLTTSKDVTPMAHVVSKSHTRYEKLGVGSKVEVCPEGWDVAEQLAQIVHKSGGAALVVDYGPADTIPVETLRAIKDHRIVSPFQTPGDADLSTDVDFQGLKIAAQESHAVDVFGPVEQGDWLHQLGIGARATALANAQPDDAGKKRIAQAYNRLVERGGGAMGKVYKVMSIVPQGSSAPVGFGGGLE